MPAYQKLFGYSAEKLDSMRPCWAKTVRESGRFDGRGGGDTPFAVLASQPLSIYGTSALIASLYVIDYCVSAYCYVARHQHRRVRNERSFLSEAGRHRVNRRSALLRFQTAHDDEGNATARYWILLLTSQTTLRSGRVRRAVRKATKNGAASTALCFAGAPSDQRVAISLRNRLPVPASMALARSNHPSGSRSKRV